MRENLQSKYIKMILLCSNYLILFCIHRFMQQKLLIIHTYV